MLIAEGGNLKLTKSKDHQWHEMYSLFDENWVSGAEIFAHEEENVVYLSFLFYEKRKIRRNICQ
jgi:hypothetical protein